MNTSRILLACVLLAGSSTGARAQGAADPSFTLTQVAPNIWAAVANLKSKTPAGANTGFVIGDDGVVVIDTTASGDADGNFSVAPARELLAAIHKLTPLPVKFIINTHYHFDHVAGNAVFAERGATVVAHRNVARWIHPENLRMFGDAIKPQQKTFIEAIVPPRVGFDGAVTLYLGSRQVRVRAFPGHTGGDSVVTVPDANVIFTGDLLWRNIAPNTIDASTNLWIETLDLLAKSSDATFVPGHGEIATAQDVVALRGYLATLRQLVAEAQQQGKTGAAVVQAAMPVLTAKYGQWDFFKYVAEPSILQTDAELRGEKRIPQPLR